MKTSPTATRIRPIILLAAPVIAIAIAVRIVHTTHHPTSIADFKQQVHEHPEDMQAQLELGAALFAQHRIPEAEAACKTAAGLAPADPRPLNSLARLAIAQNNHAEALDYLRQSLNLKYADGEVWRAYGMMIKQQSPNEALQAFHRATTINKNDSASWLELGILEMDGKQNIRGLHSLQTAAALSPNNLEAQVELGNSARVNGVPTIASQAFDKALEISPNNMPARLGSAAATLEIDPSPSGLEKAGKQLNGVIAAAPTADAYFARGQWNLLQHRYSAAIKDLTAALRIDPKRAPAHSLMSQCYAALGQEHLAHVESMAVMAAAPDSAKSETVNPGAERGE